MFENIELKIGFESIEPNYKFIKCIIKVKIVSNNNNNDINLILIIIILVKKKVKIT